MAEHPYRRQVRVRINGLLVRNNSLLLVKILSPVVKKPVWIPPGGGLEFEESMEKCLLREFKEETGLEVRAGELKYINELISPPYHAIEFFFEVMEKGGSLRLGTDPEQSTADQILQEISFIPFEEFSDLDIAPEYFKKQFINDYKTGKTGIKFIASD